MKWFLCLFCFVLICSVRSECPENCMCKDPDIECYNCLPSFIPENITRVKAHQIPLQPAMKFTTSGWQHVTNLSLTLGKEVDRTEPLSYRTLHDYEFTGIENLEHLNVTCNCYLKINGSALYGLTNVTVLDLSNNIVYGFISSDIVAGLKGGDILPHISELYLSNILDWYGTENYFYLDHLQNAMMSKPLQILDLSGTSIIFQVLKSQQTPTAILPQLQYLNISRGGEALFSLADIYQHYKATPEAVFTNLQVLDASYPYFPLTEAECHKASLYYRPFCENIQTEPNYLPYNLTELYVKNLFKSNTQLRGTQHSNHLCIEAQFFNQNRTICIGSQLNKLQKLDISDSSLTFIQPDLVQQLEALRYLDISKNKLGQVLTDDNYAYSFLQALQNIQVLLISDNGITSIPNNGLRHNKNLRTLDISHNKLVSVDFGVNYPVSFEYLDLSFNNIITLDSANCKVLENLHFSQNTPHSSTGPYEMYAGLRLDGNPLSCSCDNLCLLKFIADQDLTGNYTCSTKGKAELSLVNSGSVKNIGHGCETWPVAEVLTTIAVITIILSSITAMFVIRNRRTIQFKRLKEAGMETYVRIPKRYAAFLSFSGDDEEFVMTHVYPRLESELKQMLNTESDCVATGGTHFKAGHSIKDEISRCMEESSVVLFFLSDNFINKPWCKTEIHKAFTDGKPIILMMWGKLKLDDMPIDLRKHYEKFTRVHWLVENGEYVMRPDWRQFCETIVGLMGTEGQKSLM